MKEVDTRFRIVGEGVRKGRVLVTIANTVTKMCVF